MAVEANANDENKVDFVCERPRCGWRSYGWHNATQAEARGIEHYNEHDTGELMTDLREFEASVGFTLEEI
jgi:hypothetical protein